MERQADRFALIDSQFKKSIFDKVFPFHMLLDPQEKIEIPDSDIQYTPPSVLALFHRKRTLLHWLFTPQCES